MSQYPSKTFFQEELLLLLWTFLPWYEFSINSDTKIYNNHQSESSRILFFPSHLAIYFCFFSTIIFQNIYFQLCTIGCMQMQSQPQPPDLSGYHSVAVSLSSSLNPNLIGERAANICRSCVFLVVCLFVCLSLAFGPVGPNWQSWQMQQRVECAWMRFQFWRVGALCLPAASLIRHFQSAVTIQASHQFHPVIHDVQPHIGHKRRLGF